MNELKKLFLLTLIVAGTTVVRAESPYKVKSIFVMNFSRYIQWPTQLSSHTIGILGGSEELIAIFKDTAAKKSMGVKKMHIKVFNTVDEITQCDILFIPKEQSIKFNKVKMKKLQNTLIVTEKVGMSSRGSGINLVESNGKIRMEINKVSIESSGLKVAGQLLNMARK